jgi:hypothetical protein
MTGVRRSELTEGGNRVDFAFRIYWRTGLWCVVQHITHSQSNSMIKTFYVIQLAGIKPMLIEP